MYVYHAYGIPGSGLHFLEMTPKKVLNGENPQLQRAVEEAMELLEEREQKIIPQPEDPERVKRADGLPPTRTSDRLSDD